MTRFKTIELRPAMGGQLMCDVSPDTAGAANYTVKRDWRRELDQEIRSEGYDAFAPNPLSSAAQDLQAPEAVNLLAMVRAPNGRTAVVAGTRSKLYRYFGVENGAYVATDYVADGYFLDPGEWITIGSGFSPKGRRWEVEGINGYLVFNNQVDLPVTYRLQDMAVEAIWELREQGVASVGTIGENNGILHCANLKVIDSDKHLELMSLVRPTVSVLAGTERYDGSGNYVLTTTAGKSYHWKPGNADYSLVNGTQTLTAESDFTAQGASVTLTGRTNTLVAATVLRRVTASQTGVASSGATRAVLNNGTAGFTGNQIDATTNFFTAGHVNKKIRLQNGLERTITALVGGAPTDKVTIDGTADLAEPDMPFYLPASTNADFLVVASDGIFNTSDVGRILVWDTGEVRAIVARVNATTVQVDHDGPIASGAFGLTNPAAYTPYDDPNYIQHYQARDLWSMPGEPRRFAASFPGSSTVGTNIVVLDYPVRSLKPGMEILITGAGELGGNLTAEILFVDSSSTRLVIDQASGTTNGQALIQAADAVGSIVKFEDLTDDGSEIVRVASIGKTVVIYKRTAIFLGAYTGNVNTPYIFEKVWPKKGDEDLSKALHFRNTLTGYGLAHVYAGKNSFWIFDLITRVPTELGPLMACQEIFFREAPTGNYLGPELIGPAFVFGDFLQPYEISVQAGQYLAENSDVQIIDDDNNVVVVPKLGLQLFTHRGGGLHWNESGTPGVPIPISIREIQDGNDVVFAANNAVTREIFFWFPGGGEDKAIRFDYRQGTASTTSMEATAATTVIRPTNPAEIGPAEDWFLMGTPTGSLRRYGRVNSEDVVSGAITATKSADSVRVVASARIFRPTHVGRSIVFEASNLLFAITKYIDYRTVEVLGSGRVTTGETFRIVNAIWHRSGAAYDCVLKSGLDRFGSADIEKQLNEYIVTLAKASRVEIGVNIYGADNPDSAKVVSAKTITDSQKNMVSLFARANYFGDELTVSGINMRARIASRLYRVAAIASQSFGRREK